MVMPGRSFSSPSYRYGFNGQEKDDEVSGSGNTMTAEFWEYDTRLGRRWNKDLAISVDGSPYVCLHNSSLQYIDPNGNDPIDPRTGQEYVIDLWNGICLRACYENNPKGDARLYERTQSALRKFIFGSGKNNFDSPIFGTERQDHIASRLSDGANKFLSSHYDKETNEGLLYTAPQLDNFTQAAFSGSYIFVDNVNAEHWGYFDKTQFNVITVTDNEISEIVNFKREINYNPFSESTRYDINYVTTFQKSVSELKTETDKNGVTRKYRIITTTETTQYYKNNLPDTDHIEYNKYERKEYESN